MKKIICFIVLWCVSIQVNAEETIVILLNKDKCPLSRGVEKFIKDPLVIQITKKNKQTIKPFYGNDDWNYVRSHNVKWLPTILRLERNTNKQWIERDRIVGVKKLENLLDFLRKRSIIKGVIQPPILKSGGS